MAATKRYQLAKAAQRRQGVLAARPESRNMPSTVKPAAWESTRNAYFGTQPYTHAQLLENQMAEAGAE